MSGTNEKAFVDLLVNLCPCLQPGDGEQLGSIPEKKRGRNLKPAREGLGEVVLRLDEACEGDGKEAIHEGKTRQRHPERYYPTYYFSRALPAFRSELPLGSSRLLSEYLILCTNMSSLKLTTWSPT